ncbi:polynucleotide adenylyltransferase PcnB [Ectothiorhodospira shaposhnikovii]|uniref:polynucleotide adenylyltransferase PcnB n=1 Tax=Ectothiorhodospira shaposhnikovii TaxID=1054 RepID=UPI0039A3A0AA
MRSCYDSAHNKQHKTCVSNELNPLKPESGAGAPRIYTRAEHGISRANISEHALKVLYRLKDAGFRACLVGGGVRDLLLGREPKDFDVATDAHPEEVRSLFRNCRLIGRRFRLAHVFFGPEIIEVATFRAPHDSFVDDGDADGAAEALIEDGRIIRDNVYGTIEQDAWRRDFSINALYYDIRDFSVVDYTGGMDDLKQGVLRLIGDPEIRYREDPVRMLRAIRFATKLGFRLDEATESCLSRLGDQLLDVPPARLFDEVIKLFHAGCGLQTFEALRHHDLFGRMFPLTEEALSHEEEGFPITFVANALRNTDERIQSGKGVNPSFLYAVLLWEPVRHAARRFMEEGEAELPALQHAGGVILSRQARHIMIPKRFALPMREIWELQPRFEQRLGARALRLLTHPRFRAAYDFYCLRARSGEALAEGCEWWTRLQEVDEAEQRRMVEVSGKKPRSRRRRRSRSKSSGNA